MWAIKTTDCFDAWFTAQNETDRASVLAALLVLLKAVRYCPGLTPTP